MLWSCRHADEPNSHALLTTDIEQLLQKSEAFTSSKIDSALFYAQRALRLSQQKELNTAIAQSNFLLGKISYTKGDFDKANAYLIEAMEVFKVENDVAALGRTYDLLGKVYQYSQQPALALNYYRLAKQSFESIGDKTGLAETYGYIGHFLEKEAKYDSAIAYQLEALKIYQELADSAGLAQIYDNIGSIKEDTNLFDEALINFESAYTINSLIGNETEALVNLNNVGDIYRKTGKYQEALATTAEVLERAKSQEQIYQMRSAYRDIGKTLLEMEEFEQAYLYLDSCYEINGEIYNREIAMEIADTRAIYEVAQKEQQIDILEKDRKIDRTYRTALMTGALMISLMAVLVFYQQRVRIRKNRALFEAEKDLIHANEEKLKTELEYNHLHEEKLQQEIDNQRRELTTNALQIIRKNEFLDGLRNELKGVDKLKPEELQKRVKKIRRSIDYNFNLDDDWQEFESVFQNVHQEFFNELRKQFPSLTSAEVRLCAMIRLNLNSQDIAAIMGISQDSLRISRYRLRKKLGIAKGGNLYSFIINIG